MSSLPGITLETEKENKTKLKDSGIVITESLTNANQSKKQVFIQRWLITGWKNFLLNQVTIPSEFAMIHTFFGNFFNRIWRIKLYLGIIFTWVIIVCTPPPLVDGGEGGNHF